jgi:hypothetical protein
MIDPHHPSVGVPFLARLGEIEDLPSFSAMERSVPAQGENRHPAAIVRGKPDRSGSGDDSNVPPGVEAEDRRRVQLTGRPGPMSSEKPIFDDLPQTQQSTHKNLESSLRFDITSMDVDIGLSV